MGRSDEEHETVIDRSSLLEDQQQPLNDEERNDDQDDVNGRGVVFRVFLKRYWDESKKLWCLAAPAIFTSTAQYSLGAITQVFAGHLTTLELDAVSVVSLVIAGLAYGVMIGMGSALQTLCGQAYGAKQLHMLGIYMQKSLIILNLTCILLLPMYLFAYDLLLLVGEDEDIAKLARKYSLYVIPQLFAYAFNFPIQKFLQSQCKVMAMAWISMLGLLLHVFLSWLFIVKLTWGLVGAAAALNVSWWIVVIGQFAYVLMGYCPGAWTGFTWKAFHSLGAFAKLSIASGVMLCLEFWYYMFLVLMAGRLQNAQVAVAATSICMNLSGFDIMIFFGFGAAISVRVSNELGAGRPREAKFSVLVAVVSAALIGIATLVLVLLFKDVYASPFTNNMEVAKLISELAILFAFTLFLNSVQPVLSGVAVGAGWQWLVAHLNLACYYIVGLPLGFVLGSKFKLGVKGIWGGMMAGVGLQTLALVVITMTTNWKEEARKAKLRISTWGDADMLKNNNQNEQQVLA